ncbi:MAG: ferritin-like domain-containing protein [Ahniella sp.]|nr:ferritin-like domain-containing protein [Ahniella sp.]
MMHRDTWFALAERALLCVEPADKIEAVALLGRVMRGAQRHEPLPAPPIRAIPVPGRPVRPELVLPRELKSRKLGSPLGRAVLVHAVAHIEFNAINLALDAIYRFRSLPDTFSLDWLSVAEDEARHFQLLARRLGELGHAYGDFPAHNGLWQAAFDTADDALKRMALVPRVLEARGLDVTPGMMARLREVGDLATVACLEVILAEEVGHVAIGTRWYRYLCAEAGIADSDAHFLNLLRQHGHGAVRPPFNEPARLSAGFTVREQAGLLALSMPPPDPGVSD